MKRFSVFLVDDDPIFLKVLETQFSEQTDFLIKTFSTGEECLINLTFNPDIIFLDYYLTPDDSTHTGLQILDKIKNINPNINVVMLSSQHQIEVAVNCMKHDAFDYIIKAEGAFMRAIKCINVLRKQNELKDEVVFYKTSAITLEKMVADRTREVVEQRQIIEEKHKEMTDSIRYAEHIQRSFFPSKSLLSNNFKDYFVFFQPKDVVSGDFYWARKLSNNCFMLLTADSTGHGVPGALLSILNISCVEKAIEIAKLTEPSDILNHTRESIIKKLKREGNIDGGNDGMDCSLISFNFPKKQLTYSAANTPIWIVRKGETGIMELIEAKPDSMPVGRHTNDTVLFTQHTIDLKENDIVYAITDGYSDQFGGTKGKKFMKKNLKELLVSNSQCSMTEQKEKLKISFNKWKDDLEQVDDVTIIGIKI